MGGQPKGCGHLALTLKIPLSLAQLKIMTLLSNLASLLGSEQIKAESIMPLLGDRKRNITILLNLNVDSKHTGGHQSVI